jgi:DNA processing protein
VDRVYPRGHERLIEAIAQTGLVLSEVPCGVAPSRWRFLQRNRLIAALGTACVVVEAGWRSGARSTAREANELNRVVAAVPGPITSPLSAGCHRLLRDGAVCVTDAGEVLELTAPAGQALVMELPGPWAEHDGLSAAEIRVLDAVPLTVSCELGRIARSAGLDHSAVALALGRLELRGLVACDVTGWRRVRPTTGEPT